MAEKNQMIAPQETRNESSGNGSLVSVARKIAASSDRRVISREVDSFMREGRAALQRSETRRVEQLKRGR